MKQKADSKTRLLSTLLISALILTGCGTANVTTNTTETTQAISESQTEQFEFNLHVYSLFLESCYSEEYKEAFFNLCDALSEGKDNFKCASKEAYDFCTDPVTLNQLYPVAYKQISAEGFKDGTGYITYEIPVEE